jgi:hypothetical protein
MLQAYGAFGFDAAQMAALHTHCQSEVTGQGTHVSAKYMLPLQIFGGIIWAVIMWTRMNCVIKFKSSLMLRCVIKKIILDVSKDLVGFIIDLCRQ